MVYYLIVCRSLTYAQRTASSLGHYDTHITSK